jgi:Cu-Zn family superoxide dismutase
MSQKKYARCFAECKVSSEGKSCTGESGGNVNGMVKFAQNSRNKCEITYHITGLTPGSHGIHIHEKADFTQGCVSAGPHYNPHGHKHGGQTDGKQKRHVGDLGNIIANNQGIAKGKIIDKIIKLRGRYKIINRSVMIHENEDDLGRGDNEESKKTGNAGARIACGKIILIDNPHNKK